MKRVVTGIIMEFQEKNAIIMTADGEFVKVKKPSSDIKPGEEITSTVSDNANIGFIKYAGIAAAIIIMLIPFIYIKEAYATVAYVDVDINPSLELGINKYNKVSAVIPLNEDAKSLVENIPLKDLDIKDALGMVIDGAKDKGYIKSDSANNIDITLVKVKKDKVTISRENLISYVEDKVSQIDVDATIKINGADKKTHDDAKKENLSTNKYLDKFEKETQDTIKVDVKKHTPSKPNDNKEIQNKNNEIPESKDNNQGKGNQNKGKNNSINTPNNSDKKNNSPSSDEKDTKNNGSKNASSLTKDDAKNNNSQTEDGKKEKGPSGKNGNNGHGKNK